jgi:hypothetical protein
MKHRSYFSRILVPPAGVSILRAPRSPFSRVSETVGAKSVGPVSGLPSVATAAPAQVQRASLAPPLPSPPPPSRELPQTERIASEESASKSKNKIALDPPKQRAFEEIERPERETKYSLFASQENAEEVSIKEGPRKTLDQPNRIARQPFPMSPRREATTEPASSPQHSFERPAHMTEQFGRRAPTSPETTAALPILSQTVVRAPGQVTEPTSEPTVEIGSIEVRLVPPAAPIRRVPKPRSTGSLARHPVPFGLRQT